MKKFFSPINQAHILLASLAGTTAMTFYSYCVSWTTDHNFKEPNLLGQLFNRLFLFKGKESKSAGWGMHYLVGFLFAESYAPFWLHQNKTANLKTGLVLGGLSGIAAILIWKFTFDSHPDPPHIHFKRFAGQLFIAHVIFAVATAAVFNMLKNLSGNRTAAVHTDARP